MPPQTRYIHYKPLPKFIGARVAMTRKSRRVVMVAAAFYVFILWSAFRWGASQRYPEGSIFAHRAAELRKKLAEEAARQVPAPPPPKSTSVARFNAAVPAFVAARYDSTHIVFLVAPDAEPRFSESLHGRSSGSFVKLSAPAKPTAQLVGLQELWEPDAQSRFRLPQIVQSITSGEQWTLDVSPGFTTAVSIDRAIIASTGCSLGAGFLAAPAPAQEEAFAALSAEYFVIRRTPVELADPAVSKQISELKDWTPAADFHKQVAVLLSERMKQEVSRMDAELLANAENPSQLEKPWPATSSRHRVKHWLAVDDQLKHDQGNLDYDLRAFRITPDGVPRVLARARWKLQGTPVFLMTAWFRAEAQPALVSADASWSTKMREGEAGDFLGQRLDFETVLNEFDADQDGWAELLVHTHDGLSANITLYLYTDLGLVPTKASFDRDLTAPASCLQQE